MHGREGGASKRTSRRATGRTAIRDTDRKSKPPILRCIAVSSMKIGVSSQFAPVHLHSLVSIPRSLGTHCPSCPHMTALSFGGRNLGLSNSETRLVTIATADTGDEQGWRRAPLRFEQKVLNNIKGELPCARHMHSGSLVNDRYFYVFGGRVAACWYGRNDMYMLDLKHDHWACIHENDPRDAEVWPSPRFGHASAVSKATIVLFGGYNSGYLDDVWLYNTEKHFWARGFGRPSARYGHTLTLGPNGQTLWLLGGMGKNGLCPDIWSLDLDTMSWTQRPSPRPAMVSNKLSSVFQLRYFHTATLVGNWIVVVGGYGPSGRMLNDICAVSLVDMTWICISRPDFEGVQEFAGHQAFSSEDGMLVLCGGASSPLSKNIRRPVILDLSAFLFAHTSCQRCSRPFSCTIRPHQCAVCNQIGCHHCCSSMIQLPDRYFPPVVFGEISRPSRRLVCSQCLDRARAATDALRAADAALSPSRYSVTGNAISSMDAMPIASISLLAEPCEEPGVTVPISPQASGQPELTFEEGCPRSPADALVVLTDDEHGSCRGTPLQLDALRDRDDRDDRDPAHEEDAALVFCPQDCDETRLFLQSELRQHRRYDCARTPLSCSLLCGVSFARADEETHLGFCLKATVSCTSLGCGETFERGDMQSHLDTCPFKMVSCPQSCEGEAMRRSDVEDHVQHACPNTTLSCPNGCGSTFQRKFREAHLDECLMKTVKCEEGCGWMGTQKQLARHLESCEYVLMQCPNSGCEEMMRRCLVPSHVEHDCPWMHVPCLFNPEGCSCLRRDLLSHHADCPYVELECAHGCGLRMERRMLPSHDLSCSHLQVPCDIDGCEEQVKRCERDVHVAESCGHVLVRCPSRDCEEKVKRKDLRDHINSCDFVELECVQVGCKQRFLRRDEERHAMACEMVRVECKTCGEMIRRCDIDAHRSMEMVSRQQLEFCGAMERTEQLRMRSMERSEARRNEEHRLLRVAMEQSENKRLEEYSRFGRAMESFSAAFELAMRGAGMPSAPPSLAHMDSRSSASGVALRLEGGRSPFQYSNTASLD
eukprot:Rmarinus@m.28746